MSKQLHKNLIDYQVKSFFKGYLDKKIKINYILQMLNIKRSRLFELLVKYRKDPDSFSIQYEKKTINRKINPDIEKNIIKELVFSPRNDRGTKTNNNLPKNGESV